VTVPIRVQVGHLEPREVYRVSAASLAADPHGAVVHARRGVADEIERQSAEESK
jgi:hypothetical protein